MPPGLYFAVLLLIATPIHNDIKLIRTKGSGAWVGATVDSNKTGALGKCLEFQFLKDDLPRIIIDAKDLSLK